MGSVPELLGLPGPKTCLDVYTGVGVSRASDGELVRTEGRPDVVQFSGGEPSIHPQIIEMLHAAKTPRHSARDAQYEREADRR